MSEVFAGWVEEDHLVDGNATVLACTGWLGGAVGLRPVGNAIPHADSKGTFRLSSTEREGLVLPVDDAVGGDDTCNGEDCG